MLFRSSLISFFILLMAFPVKAQRDEVPEITQLIEWLQNNPDDQIDYAELAERLTYFKKHPLDLNKAGEAELNELGILNALQIAELLDHREQNGLFLDLLELQSLESLNLETIQRIMPFVRIGGIKPLEGVDLGEVLAARHDLLFRVQQSLQQQKGFENIDPDQSGYLGSPRQFLIRYRYRLNQNLSAALNMENDPGEQFFKGRRTGFDFLSGHLYLKDLGKLKKLVLGDYDLQFGQGLALWSGLSFGKSPQIQQIAKPDVGLKPYSSFNEGLFFRGIAATLAHKNWRLSPFFSFRKLDASLNEEQEVGSVLISGYHRTLTEMQQRRNLDQQVFGTNLQWKYQKLHLGASFMQTQFSKKFAPGTEVYNQFEFAGSHLRNISLNADYTYKNSYFFGEWAQSTGSHSAAIMGVLSSLSPNLSLGLHYRNIPKNYHSFYKGALSESSNASNERGFLAGIQFKPHTQWEWLFYADTFRFPWLRFGVDAPSSGFEVLSQLIFKPNKRFRVSFLSRLEEKQENAGDGQTLKTLENIRHYRYRFDLDYWVNKYLEFRNRIEMVSIRSERAYLFFQDVFYKPLQSKMSGNCRFAVFHVPGYDSRIYAYQNDVLYSYSIFAYQYQGFQFYANLRYRLIKGMDAWLNYESQHYLNRDRIGSGLNEIEGNRRSAIKLQLRYQF